MMDVINIDSIEPTAHQNSTPFLSPITEKKKKTSPSSTAGCVFPMLCTAD